QEMQHKCHVSKLVKARIDIAGRSGHAAPNYQLLPPNPGNHDLVLQPAADLPMGHPSKRPEPALSANWVRPNELSDADHCLEQISLLISSPTSGWGSCVDAKAIDICAGCSSPAPQGSLISPESFKHATIEVGKAQKATCSASLAVSSVYRRSSNISAWIC